ncbi:MAG: RDD family protein [Nitrospirae bacterium]|nr:RDD family protein [Nitrospirota bacterium]
MIYSDYSDDAIRSLLSEGGISFDTDAYKLLCEEAEKRSIPLPDFVNDIEMVRASIRDRFLAIFVDYVILGLIFIASVPFIQKVVDLNANTALLIILGFNIMFFFKDSTGQSPGKRLLKIRVVRKDNFGKPKVLSLFIRNLFLVLGPVEVIVLFSSKDHERIGDRVAATLVVQSG